MTQVRSQTARGELQVVGDEEHGHAALAAQLVEDCHHLGLGGDVQGGRRLVGEEQLWLGERGPRRS